MIDHFPSRFLRRQRTASLSHEAFHRARAAAHFFALQDLILVAYLLIVLGLLLGGASMTNPTLATGCAQHVYAAIAVTVLGAVAARGLDGASWWKAGLYRVCLVGVIIENYLMLRHLLPLIRPDTVDATLYRIDISIFGVEPALWLEKLNQRFVVEWFSFFYLSYFWINAAYLVAIAFIRRGGRETSAYAIGILITFCVGQLGYMAVPGFGPVGYLASSFHAPLDGGFFWSCVSRTVSAGSAMKDIFPSLHTAVPTFLTWFAWQRSRTEPRWRLVALATGFFAANIIVSTMLLRWHFAIDVVAGLALGSAAGFLAPRLALVEERFRDRLGVPHAWDFRDVAERGADAPVDARRRSRGGGSAAKVAAAAE